MPLANRYGGFFTGLAESLKPLPGALAAIKNSQDERAMAQQRLGLDTKRFGLEQTRAEREKAQFDMENRSINLADAEAIIDEDAAKIGDVYEAKQYKAELRAAVQPNGKVYKKDFDAVRSQRRKDIEASKPIHMAGIGGVDPITRKPIPELKEPTKPRTSIEMQRWDALTKQFNGDEVAALKEYDRIVTEEQKAKESAAMARTIAGKKDSDETGMWIDETNEVTKTDDNGFPVKMKVLTGYQTNKKTGEIRKKEYPDRPKLTPEESESNWMVYQKVQDDKAKSDAFQATLEPHEIADLKKRIKQRDKAKFIGKEEKKAVPDQMQKGGFFDKWIKPKTAAGTEGKTELPAVGSQDQATLTYYQQQRDALKKEYNDKFESKGPKSTQITQPKKGVTPAELEILERRMKDLDSEIANAQDKLREQQRPPYQIERMQRR